MENLKIPIDKFKGDSRYTGSDNEDDFNDFTMNKGFIQYNYSPLSNRSNVSFIFFWKFVPLFFAY